MSASRIESGEKLKRKIAEVVFIDDVWEKKPSDTRKHGKEQAEKDDAVKIQFQQRKPSTVMADAEVRQKKLTSFYAVVNETFTWNMAYVEKQMNEDHLNQIMQGIQSHAKEREDIAISILSSAGVPKEHLYFHDLKELLPPTGRRNGWIGSSVISAISALICNRAEAYSCLPKCFILSTWQTRSVGQTTKIEDDIQLACKALKFPCKYDIIMAPLCLASHWFLYVLDFRDKSLKV